MKISILTDLLIVLLTYLALEAPALTETTIKILDTTATLL